MCISQINPFLFKLLLVVVFIRAIESKLMHNSIEKFHRARGGASEINDKQRWLQRESKLEKSPAMSNTRPKASEKQFTEFRGLQLTTVLSVSTLGVSLPPSNLTFHLL